MTSGELKFALKLEEVLNSLPEPEYRQLVVETLMVLGLVAQSSAQSSFGETTIVVEHLINHAKHLFLVDQVNTLYILCLTPSHPPPSLPHHPLTCTLSPSPFSFPPSPHTLSPSPFSSPPSPRGSAMAQQWSVVVITLVHVEGLLASASTFMAVPPVVGMGP